MPERIEIDSLALWLTLVLYMGAALGIGWWASRQGRNTPSDYFLAGRSARSLVLFMALFGTNVTPFVLMGVPGLAYHAGLGVFGYNAALVVLAIPLSFYWIGRPAWLAARELGAVTPAELYRLRFESPALGRLIFLVFLMYTLPYMVTSVAGLGLAVDVFSGGALSLEHAAIGILAITIIYTVAGGMRATMWTNVFQGAFFMVFLAWAFVAVSGGQGGLAASMQRVVEARPELLVTQAKGPFVGAHWLSWGLTIGFTVVAFPHMFVRILAAADLSALKNSVRLYPLAMLLLWLPVTLFGVWGAVEFPGLVAKASDRIFPLLVQSHMGAWAQGLALAAILAAVMSTLDAQMLTLSSMLTRDLRSGWSEAQQLRWSRMFLVVLAVLVYLGVIWRPASIFDLAKLSFSGYVTLLPTLWLSLRWRRFNLGGAVSSIVVGNLVLWLVVGGYWPDTLLNYQVVPAAWAVGLGLVAGVGYSLVQASPLSARAERLFNVLEGH